MEISIKFNSAEDREVFLKDSGQNILSALDAANDALAAGRTFGDVSDAKGAVRGSWSLEITAEDLRDAAVRETVQDTGKAKVRKALRDLDADYLDYVRYLYHCGGLVRENTIGVFLTNYRPGQVGETVELDDLLELAREDALDGPKNYLLRDDFREHLFLHDKLPEYADWLFDVDAKYL